MPKVYIDENESGGERRFIECGRGENLYEVLIRNQISISDAVCKGAGICQGCRVYVAEEGMECLACRYIVDAEELHIRLGGRKMAAQSILLAPTGSELSKSSKTLTGSELSKDSEVPNRTKVQNNSEGSNSSEVPGGSGPTDGSGRCFSFQPPLGLAVDIGTTTIASALIELETGRLCSQAGCLNSQAQAGADVISRIQYASAGDGSGSGRLGLHQCIVSDIQSLLAHYEAEGYPQEQIKRICFSGNTAMLHFLLNRPVDGMAGYPFTPDFLEGKRYEWEGRDVLILPGKSAFVGADIVSGLRFLNLGIGPEYKMLVDLGTNGELWLLNERQGICTSVSCGPAFDNSITHGTAYGATLFEELYRAYQEGKMDSSGLLQEEWFAQGIPCRGYVITQDTIRQIQLAKAAVRTGIDLIAYELQVPLEKISQVYLAGGFGFFMNLNDAFGLGLLPKELEGRIHVRGNTSLGGAIQALGQPEDMLALPESLKRSRTLDLSMSKNFQECFLHQIAFPERKEEAGQK